MLDIRRTSFTHLSLSLWPSFMAVDAGARLVWVWEMCCGMCVSHKVYQCHSRPVHCCVCVCICVSKFCQFDCFSTDPTNILTRIKSVANPVVCVCVFYVTIWRKFEYLKNQIIAWNWIQSTWSFSVVELCSTYLNKKNYCGDYIFHPLAGAFHAEWCLFNCPSVLLCVCVCVSCYLWVWELSAMLCSPGGGEAAFRNLYGCHKAAFIQLNSCFLQPGTSHPNSIGTPLWVTTLPALVCKASSSKNTNGWINKRHKTHLHENTDGYTCLSSFKGQAFWGFLDPQFSFLCLTGV